jgi:hypothetical protein
MKETQMMPDSNFPLLPIKINTENHKKQDPCPKIHMLQQIPNMHSPRKRKTAYVSCKEPPRSQITSLKPKAHQPQIMYHAAGSHLQFLKERATGGTPRRQ